MGVTNSNKTTNLTRIDCDGTFELTLALTAAPDIVSNPTDIVLMLDRSGSMSGAPLANLKNGAKTFIDIIDEATDDTQDGCIGSGSRIGIVSFADTATQNTALISSVSSLDEAVDSLVAGGDTNHADAFERAAALFDPTSSNKKVLVMFTDGKTTAGPDPSPVAAAARAQGITIYAVGLIGSEGIDPSVLNDWATDPDYSHVAITPDDAELEDLFEDLAANISKTGATSIVIHETVAADFRILSTNMPTKGSAMLTGSNTLRWNIPELGVTASEGASLTFVVQHIGTSGGTKKVNASITYEDEQNNTVTFPDPSITVDCSTVITPETCPTPVDLVVEGCSDSLVVDAGEIDMESMGRIVQVDVTVRNVCPGKRVALAVMLSEQDENGVEYPRGTKTITIPAHTAPTCRDVLVKCIKFVLPEDLNVSGERFCAQRNLKARFIAHHIDSDFACCDTIYG